MLIIHRSVRGSSFLFGPPVTVGSPSREQQGAKEREREREREDKKRVNKVRRQPMPERKNGDPVLSCPSIIHRTRQRKKVKKNRHSLTDLTGHGSKG
jgi:hypothetical protein